MSSAISANVGEWSELYALSNVLVNAGAFAANSEQEKLPDTFIKVASAFVASRNPERVIEYRPSSNAVEVIDGDLVVGVVSKNELEQASKRVFEDLTSGEYHKTFALASGDFLLRLLSREKPSADSTQTMSDLDFIIEDPATKVLSPRVGFSIKSQLGSASTLLNAGGTTNFVYQVHLPEGLDLADLELTGESPQRDVKKMIDAGCEIKFQQMESARFQENLEKLDSQMPEFVAGALLTYYATDSSRFSEVLDEAFPPADPKSSQRIFKVKQFLGAIAMGLRPSSLWDGDVTKFRGLLVVKSNGDVVMYYLYNLLEFQDFLFSAVKFETASTTRHKFGEVYEEGGSLRLKLNLQIRFVK